MLVAVAKENLDKSLKQLALKQSAILKLINNWKQFAHAAKTERETVIQLTHKLKVAYGEPKYNCKLNNSIFTLNISIAFQNRLQFLLFFCLKLKRKSKEKLLMVILITIRKHL